MTDIIDLAQAHEEKERALALAKVGDKFSRPSAHYCLDCDEHIPEQRRALGGVKYCIECQLAVERDHHL